MTFDQIAGHAVKFLFNPVVLVILCTVVSALNTVVDIMKLSDMYVSTEQRADICQ